MSTTPGLKPSFERAPAIDYGEALLPAGLGRQLAEHFGVDRINGRLGNELKFENQKLTANYLRDGIRSRRFLAHLQTAARFRSGGQSAGGRRYHGVGGAAERELNNLDPEYRNPSVKLVQNCEMRLFQRPDDAIHRGFDKEAEADMAAPDNFISNFEPLTSARVEKILNQRGGVR